jgi:hypothetical protein
LQNTADYAVAIDTYNALVSAPPSTNVLVEMAGRWPAPIRQQLGSRTIPLLIYVLGTRASDRKAKYDALVAALDSSSALVPLVWTDGGATYRHWCFVTSAQTSETFFKVAAELVAPNPVAEVL